MLTFLFFPSPRESQISRLQETINSLEGRLSQMSEEKQDLLVKIEAGEGANTALSQLKQENVRHIS